MMLVGELLKAASFTAEGLGLPGQWARSDYCRALDWAAQTAVAQLKRNRTWRDPVSVVAGTALITLTPIPLLVLNVRNAMTQTWIPPTTETYEDQMDPAWRTASGVPSGWMLEAANTIRFNRNLPADTSFVVQVIDPPLPMGLDTDPVDPRLPANVIQALHLGAAAFLFQQAGDNQDFGRAKVFMEEFQAGVMSEAIHG